MQSQKSKTMACLVPLAILERVSDANLIVSVQKSSVITCFHATYSLEAASVLKSLTQADVFWTEAP